MTQVTHSLLGLTLKAGKFRSFNSSFLLQTSSLQSWFRKYQQLSKTLQTNRSIVRPNLSRTGKITLQSRSLSISIVLHYSKKMRNSLFLLFNCKGRSRILLSNSKEHKNSKVSKRRNSFRLKQIVTSSSMNLSWNRSKPQNLPFNFLI